jgi:hypothetical protein
MTRPETQNYTKRTAWVNIQTDEMYESREDAVEEGVPEHQLAEMSVPADDYDRRFRGGI